MEHSEVVIRLEFDEIDFEGSEEALKESVYEYLTELIENDDLSYEVEAVEKIDRS